MKKEAILGLVRHALTTFGGMLAARGTIGDSDVELLAGSVATLLGIAWSVWEKHQRPKPPMSAAVVGIFALTLMLSGCAATVTKTDDVTSVTWVWGAAQVSAGEECSEGQDCDGVSISGGHASEGFLAAVMSPISTVLKGLLAGL